MNLDINREVTLPSLPATPSRRAVRTRVSATRYLRDRLSRDDYSLRCLASDGLACPVDWSGHTLVSFFVSEAIPTDLGQAQRSAILARIASEDQGRVWGYKLDAPADADDTAFVLRTLRNLGKSVDISGLDLFFHDGAFTTFEQGPCRQPTQMVFQTSVENNFRVHPEVLANIYRVLADAGEERRIDETLVRAAQAPDGYFRSYFYPGKYYATWMFADLLAVTGRLQDARERAIRFIAESQNQDGSWGQPGNAYETALALDSCRPDEISRMQVEKALAFLLASQEIDGSWRTRQPIWVFRYTDAPAVMWEGYDTNRMITTAVAVKALRRHEGSLVG